MKKILAFILLSVTLFSCSNKNPKLYELVDSDHSGIDFNNQITETKDFNVLTDEYIFNGGGVAASDFNNDGNMDLFFTGNQVSNKLYLNQGDFKFEDITDEAGLNSSDFWSTGVAVADVNGDGWQDIFVGVAMLEGKKENKLYINQGIGSNNQISFKEMASEYGLVNDKNTMAALFFDYDKDGLLDLYVLNNEQEQFSPTNYRDKIVDGSAKSTDQLYKNMGDGTFKDVSLEAGITIEGFGLGIAALDINKDGWTDLYVSNDYLTNDVLYINQRDGTFKNEMSSYFKHQSKFSMGNDAGDFNNDGIDDIITVDMLGETNYRKKTTMGKSDYQDIIHNNQWGYEFQQSRNMLQKGNPTGIPYSEIGMMAGVYQTDWSWSPLFMDANNDGYKDLMITNGFPRDITDMDFINFKFEYERFASHEILLDSMPSVKIPNYAYKNVDSYQFDNVTDDWGVNIPSFSNGAVYADLDNDGDLDYVVNNINDKAFVFNNSLNKKEQPINNHYLKIELQGPKNNSNGIGSRIQIKTADGKSQYYNQFLTRGYMSSVDPRVHFGLGSQSSVESLSVIWPDEKTQQLSNIAADQSIALKYSDASQSSTLNTTAQKQTIFNEVSADKNLSFVHTELDFDDFSVQRLIQHKISQSGPCLAVADINNDGLEDVILGSSESDFPTAYLQNADGSFSSSALFTNKDYFENIEECIRPFDFENDGDLDLIITSKRKNYQQQNNYIAINDGKGTFSIQNADESFEGSVIAVGDYNGDGLDDVFVGGGPRLREYPQTNPSRLLINQGGRLQDSGAAIIKDIDQMGMVTDAKWGDLNGDGLLDLVVVGEFEPIKIYLHSTDGLERYHSNLDDYRGLWSSVVLFDNDADGDLDILAGNIGANNYLHLSDQTPITLVADDLDNNGSVDPVLFYYEKGKDSIKRAYPYAFKDNLVEQSPRFRKQFKFYKNYANTDLKEFYTKEEFQNAHKLTANFELSIYIESLGNNQFNVTALPQEVQIAPLTDLMITDYNNDDYPDIIGVGNDYRYESFIGRLDASNGLLLRGTGTDKFEVIPPAQSGIVIPVDGREIAKIKTASGKENYIVTQNRDQVLLFSRSN